MPVSYVQLRSTPRSAALLVSYHAGQPSGELTVSVPVFR